MRSALLIVSANMSGLRTAVNNLLAAARRADRSFARMEEKGYRPEGLSELAAAISALEQATRHHMQSVDSAWAGASKHLEP